MKRKIYMTQDSRVVDVSPALEHGDVIVPLIPPGDANFSQEDTLERIRDGLEEFDPVNDCILLLGDPMAIAMTGIVLRDMFNFGGEQPTIKFLKWNRMSSSYLPLEVDFTWL